MTRYSEIRSFWDSRPCGTTHIDLPPGSREYFLEFDKYFLELYPYLTRFLDLPSLQGKCVLEIGLGSGFELHRIAQVAETTLGLDMSGETLRLCERRKAHFAVRFISVNASATHIPLRDSCVDVVVSIGCLHHIPDIQLAVDEIRRVLRPGGRFLGMVYNKDSWRYRVFIPYLSWLRPAYRAKTAQQLVNELYDGPGNPYATVFSRAEIRRIFSGFHDFKFQVQNFYGGDIAPRIGRLIPRSLLLATMGKILGLDLYFKATKRC